MKVAVKPRSDQWNADDFTGGPRTFTVAGAKHGTAEALYDIELVEGEGRVWRPPNGMLSVLIQLWGDEAYEWIGRRVTLFKDPSVRFGKDVPGGIRISHMSDIGPKGASPSITVSRGQRRPYQVKPLLDVVQRDWQQEIDTAQDTDTLNRLWSEAPAQYQDAMRARAAQLTAATTPTEGADVG